MTEGEGSRGAGNIGGHFTFCHATSHSATALATASTATSTATATGDSFRVVSVSLSLSLFLSLLPLAESCCVLKWKLQVFRLVQFRRHFAVAVAVVRLVVGGAFVSLSFA